MSFSLAAAVICPCIARRCSPADSTELLLTGGGDTKAIIWDVATGEHKFTFPHKGAVRGVAWMEGDLGFATASDALGTSVPCSIQFFALADNPDEQSDKPYLVVVNHDEPKTKITRIAWMPFNAHLLAATEKGFLQLIDPKDGSRVQTVQAHGSAAVPAKITSMSLSADKSLILTSSDDKTAKLWRIGRDGLIDPKPLQVYEADCPLNAAAFCPGKELILAGGGQEARSVTTTASSEGHFEARFFSMVFGGQLATVKGHFGPINTMAFSPDGRSYASGGEDGFIRLHHLDEEYDALAEEADAELADAQLESEVTDGTLDRLRAEEEEAAAREEAEARAAAAVGGAGAGGR